MEEENQITRLDKAADNVPAARYNSIRLFKSLLVTPLWPPLRRRRPRRRETALYLAVDMPSTKPRVKTLLLPLPPATKWRGAREGAASKMLTQVVAQRLASSEWRQLRLALNSFDMPLDKMTSSNKRSSSPTTPARPPLRHLLTS